MTEKHRSGPMAPEETGRILTSTGQASFTLALDPLEWEATAKKYETYSKIVSPTISYAKATRLTSKPSTGPLKLISTLALERETRYGNRSHCRVMSPTNMDFVSKFNPSTRNSITPMKGRGTGTFTSNSADPPSERSTNRNCCSL